jgi:subtilase family serine protease
VIPVPQVPDLSGRWSNVSNTGPSKKTGYKVSGNLTVSNTGNGTANGVVVNVYLSNDTNPDSGDVLIKTLNYSSIRTGTSKSSTISYTTSTNPHGKYLISVIDPNNAVTESNEGNNVTSAIVP